jgi:hypothetical protein
MRQVKEYDFNGLAGCVSQRKSRITKTLVGVYHGVQSGMEEDPENPWITVCEVHHNCVCHPTLALAKDHAVDPTGWCEECRVE